uniref:Rho guanine nucleotide exchange factor 2 n=1 Tax=Eptatretus burgeri TaxID=7764 RepID=A0A8C4N7X8_EPTBU
MVWQDRMRRHYDLAGRAMDPSAQDVLLLKVHREAWRDPADFGRKPASLGDATQAEPDPQDAELDPPRQAVRSSSTTGAHWVTQEEAALRKATDMMSVVPPRASAAGDGCYLGNTGSGAQIMRSPEEEEEKDLVADVPLRRTRVHGAAQSSHRHSWEPGKRVSWDDTVQSRSVSWCSIKKDRRPSLPSYYSFSLDCLDGDGVSQDDEMAEEELQSACSRGPRDPRRAPLVASDDADVNWALLSSANCAATKRGMSGGKRHWGVSMPSLAGISQHEADDRPWRQQGLKHKERTKLNAHLNGSVTSLQAFGSRRGSDKYVSTGADSLPNLQSDIYGSQVSLQECINVQGSSHKQHGGKKGDEKGGLSRTLSMLKNRMSSIREKGKGKKVEKDNAIPPHQFELYYPITGASKCHYCGHVLKPREVIRCLRGGMITHKHCKDKVSACVQVQLRKSDSLLSVEHEGVTNKLGPKGKERPRSVVLLPQTGDMPSMGNLVRHTLYSSALCKSISTINISGGYTDVERVSYGLHRSKSQSSEGLHKANMATSMESLVDEDSLNLNFMGDFETVEKYLEKDSWSQAVEEKFAKKQKKNIIQRQDVIYELMYTEMNYVRTLRILSEIYRHGFSAELQLDASVTDKVFPCLNDLIDLHTQFLWRLLDRRKEGLKDRSDRNFTVQCIGDLLRQQFSKETGEKMKDVYGAFCSQQEEAVNTYKELLSKEKKLQNFIKKQSMNPQVRRQGLQECVLLITQRLTKYPPLIDRIAKCTKGKGVQFCFVSVEQPVGSHVYHCGFFFFSIFT